MSMILEDKEERLGLMDTEINRNLYQDIQKDHERDIDLEIEL